MEKMIPKYGKCDMISCLYNSMKEGCFYVPSKEHYHQKCDWYILKFPSRPIITDVTFEIFKKGIWKLPTNEYHFRGLPNLLRVINDCIKDHKLSFLLTGDKKNDMLLYNQYCIVGISKQIIISYLNEQEQILLQGNEDTNFWEEKVNEEYADDLLPFKLFVIEKTKISDVIKLLKNLNIRMKEIEKDITKQMRKDKKGHESQKFTVKVF